MMPTLWPFAAGFVVTLLIVPWLIHWQRRRAMGQQIYEDGPKAHAAKQGTPTLGGLAFPAAALAGFAFAPSANDARLLFLVCVAAVIGAVDDSLILLKRRPLGLKARWKFGLLALLAIAYLYLLSRGGSTPTAQMWFGTAGVTLPPWLWWVLSICALVGSANAVNLADGLDGLAAGAIIPPLLVLSLASLSSVSIGVVGACVAFLWFNRHPARIFMGDAGSLALGALLAATAIQCGWLLVLPLLGFVFVVEALSVMMQVASFKLTGKRIFKMSPLHHHFELSGWTEGRVTAMFVVASTAATCATVALMALARPAQYLK
jgi:phospho-N-acetylmuramoyl-pentapeptide-transferase